MARFVVTDEGDYVIARVSAPTPDEAREQVSNAQGICPDDLQIWTASEYRNQVLARPWWELETEGLL